MTIAVTKTKAEQALSEQFAAVYGELPGTDAISRARKDAFGTFSTLGLPHRRVEEWKYTDLRTRLTEAFAPAVDDDETASTVDIDAALGALAGIDAIRVVFVNGSYRPKLSSPGGVAGLTVKPLAENSGDLSRLSVSEDDAVIALNTAFMSDGAMVSIADKVALAKPLFMVFARAGAAARAVTTRNVISIGAGARATLLEANVVIGDAGAGQINSLSEVAVGDGAAVTHIKCTREGAGSTHLSTWIGEIGAEADYKAFQFTADTSLTRNNLFVTFNGEHSKLDISGAFLARGKDHVDTTLVVDHAVPHCESRELFKGVLDDKGRGIFQGKVIVRQDAQKSDGKQMAQALMLSEDAEFDSKPELEIYADDVVCGHGSTVAELDEEMMFYMRSRGIPEEQARALMIESFIGEAFEKVENEAIRAALAGMALEWLARKG